jgi:hypothetical protein
MFGRNDGYELQLKLEFSWNCLNMTIKQDNKMNSCLDSSKAAWSKLQNLLEPCLEIFAMHSLRNAMSSSVS